MEIYTTSQSYITCPHCGYRDDDSWESSLEDGEEETVDCENCEKPFVVSVERLFSTRIEDTERT